MISEAHVANHYLEMVIFIQSVVGSKCILFEVKKKIFYYRKRVYCLHFT